jgi:hypothetical protein
MSNVINQTDERQSAGYVPSPLLLWLHHMKPAYLIPPERPFNLYLKTFLWKDIACIPNIFTSHPWTLVPAFTARSPINPSIAVSNRKFSKTNH